MITSTHTLTDSDISLSQNSHQSINNVVSKLSFRSTQEKCSRLKNVINNLYKKGPMEIITKTRATNLIHDKNPRTIDFVCKGEEIEKYAMIAAIKKNEKKNNQENFETDSAINSVKELVLSKYINTLSYICIENEKFGCLSILEVSFNLLEINISYFNDFCVHVFSNAVCNKLSQKKKKLVNLLLSGQNYLESKKKDTLGCSCLFWSHKPSNNLLFLNFVIIDKDFCGKNDILVNKIHENFSHLELRILHEEVLKSLVCKVINELNRTSKEKCFFNRNSFEIIVNFSLPIDTVKSALTNCQSHISVPSNNFKNSFKTIHLSSQSYNNQFNQSKKEMEISNMLTDKLLCLYCEQKFSSDSLHQKHIKKVHFFPTKRRLRKNSKKRYQQKCCYCTINKFWDDLEDLFQHMVKSHADKYFGCLHCKTRYHSKKALTSHNYHLHYKTQHKQTVKRKRPNIKNEINHGNLLTKLFNRNAEVKKKNAANKISVISFFNASEIDIVYKSINRIVHENSQHHFNDEHSTYLFSGKQLVLNSNVENHHLLSQNSFSFTKPLLKKKVDTPIFSFHHLCLSNDFRNSDKFMIKFSKNSFIGYSCKVICKKYQFFDKYGSQDKFENSSKNVTKFDLSTQEILKKKQASCKNIPTLHGSKNKLLQVILNDHIKTEKYQESLSDKEVCTNNDNVKYIPTQLIIDSENNSYQSDFISIEKSHSEICTNASEKKLSSVFSFEFENFIKLKQNVSCCDKKETIFFTAELSGEWSRPKTYVCSVCAEKFVSIILFH